MKERSESIASPISSLCGCRRRLGGLDQIVDDRVDPPWARRAEQLDLCGGKRGGLEHAGPHCVVDVVVYVRDAVDEPDDLAFERLGLVLAGVLEDSVAHLCGEVEAAPVSLELIDDAQRVLVVAKAKAEPLAEGFIERFFACVPERGCPRSWPSPIASVRSSFRRSARATPREIPVVSSVCVSRVR
jgi:hypothetical protein